MGQTRGVDDDEIGAVVRSRVNALDELVLAVALERFEAMAEAFGFGRE